MKKFFKTIIKWAPVIYPIIRKIIKERKTSKRNRIPNSRLIRLFFYGPGIGLPH
ncbi:hypothetical protein HRF58_10410 [Bacillus velezensis]|nr:hypothetical protein [Bacillus velezensis]NRF35118.1 hypothetical protein [Bacillus velezensis]